MGGNFSHFGGNLGTHQAGHFDEKMGSNFNKNFGDNAFNYQTSSISSNSGNSGRYIVSQSSSTNTKTVNGVITKVTITKIKYSDGSEEEKKEESTTIQH